MAKLAIQTLTDEYLNNTPLSLINPRGMLGAGEVARLLHQQAAAEETYIYN